MIQHNCFFVVLLCVQAGDINLDDNNLAMSDYVKVVEVPYFASVILKSRDVCGGTIIGESWVITSATCLSNTKKKDKSKVVAGVEFLQSNQFRSSQIREVEEIRDHVEFQKGIIGAFDISLIKVNKPFLWTSSVQRIEIWNATWPAASRCRLIGWGKLSLYRIVQNGLRKRDLEVNHGGNSCPCINTYWENLICAQDEEPICGGDVGSGLICNGLLAGVAHTLYSPRACAAFSLFGRKGKLSCGRADMMSAFTYTCPMLNWIGQSVPKVPLQPISCTAHSLKPLLILIEILFYFYLLDINGRYHNLF